MTKEHIENNDPKTETFVPFLKTYLSFPRCLIFTLPCSCTETHVNVEVSRTQLHLVPERKEKKEKTVNILISRETIGLHDFGNRF